MAGLLQLSESRANLPEFVGATLIEKLINGRDEARSRLLKYTGAIRFQKGTTDDLLAEIETWQHINQPIIEQRMADPATDTLPEQIALEFGPKKAQQFVIAGYSYAVEGLGPWVSGDLATRVAADPRVPQPWVEDDAHQRLSIFASIVKLDDDGDLERIFRPETAAVPTSGFGFLPAVVKAIGPTWTVVALVLSVLATVGLFLIFAHSIVKTRLNNKILADLCAEAKKAGNTSVMKACIEAAKEGQQDPFAEALKRAATIMAVGGVIYAAIVFGGPALSQSMRRQRASR